MKRRYIGIIDIWCSCLVVWYYIFIWLLVLFGRCCTFFHLQGAFLTHGNYFRKIGAREKGGGGGILRLKSKFQHRGGLSFAFLCLFSCMVVLCGTIEVCRVEVYSVLFAVCAFYPVCDMWCCLSPYNAI